MSFTLSDWVYQGITTQGHILAVHPDYFLLKGGLERCLYRLARKHAGKQSQGWKCSLPKLYEKTGSECSLRRFKFEINKILASDSLPEYRLSWDKDKQKGGEILCVNYRTKTRPLSWCGSN